MSAVVFRSLSAPRAVLLIPNGRLKLLLGAASVQLALAGFISGVVWVMVVTGSTSSATPPGSAGTLFAPVFAVTYAALTLQFLGYYLASRSRFGAFWLLTWSVWARLISAVLQSAHVRLALGTPAGLGAVVAISVLAWLAFAVGYLSARHIPRPHWNNIGMGIPQRSAATPQNHKILPGSAYTRSAALRMILTGGPRQRRAILGILVPLIVILVASIAGRFHLPRDVGYPLVGLICIMAGPLTGSFAGVMAQRAKPLWLQSGLGRSELFATLEARSWRVVLCAALVCWTLAGGWLAVRTAAPSPLGPASLWVWIAAVLVIPLASGAMMIYAQLQFVRGRRVLDILVIALAIGLWMIESFSIMAGAAKTVVIALLAAQIILVPPLRLLALRRWEKIDWVIHRGARNPWGLT
jgi:hypothetical protein